MCNSIFCTIGMFTSLVIWESYIKMGYIYSASWNLIYIYLTSYSLNLNIHYKGVHFIHCTASDAVETTGVFGPDARDFFHELSHRIKEESGEPLIHEHLPQRIAVAIQSINQFNEEMWLCCAWNIMPYSAHDLIYYQWRTYSACRHIECCNHCYNCYIYCY